MTVSAANDPIASPESKPSRLVRLDEVIARVGVGKSAIYARIRAKTFPAPVPLGGGSVAWVEAELDAWIVARIEERDKAA